MKGQQREETQKPPMAMALGKSNASTSMDGCVSGRHVTKCRKYKSLAHKHMCQQDVEEEDREWQLVESPQKAQGMLEYVTKALVSTV